VKVNRFVQVLLVLLVAGGAGLYFLFEAAFDVILEPRNMFVLTVEELPGGRPLRLKIRGVAPPAQSVYRIENKTKGSVIVVLAHGGLAKEGTSGTIEYELSVPDSVDEVRFGNSSAPIWKRNSVPAPTPN
jgi:hypothetical protein